MVGRILPQQKLKMMSSEMRVALIGKVVYMTIKSFLKTIVMGLFLSHAFQYISLGFIKSASSISLETTLVEVHVSIQKQCYINHVASQQLCPDRRATVIMYTVILCLCVYIQLFAQRVYIYFAHRVCMYIYIYKHCYMYVPICSIYTYFVLFYI